MTRHLAVVIAALTLVAACSPSDSVSSTTTSTSAPAEQQEPDRPAFLAVASPTGDLTVLSDDFEAVMSVGPDSGSAFRQPAWLSADVVVAAATGPDGPGLAAVEVGTGDTVWTVQLDTVPFYYSPAPVSEELATTSLRNDPSGEGLIAELVRSGTVEPLERAAPFYTAWAPDGRSLAVHAGATSLEVRSDGRSEELASSTGVFQAPSWTTNGLYAARTVGEEQFLTRWDGGDAQDIATVAGPVRFLAAGSRVAIQSSQVDESGGVAAGVRTQQVPSIPGGRLVVVDADSGEVSTVSNLLVAFFQWDPSGHRLLYASFGDVDSLGLTLHIWEDGESIELASIEAQPFWFRDVVPFFDQFAQSMSLWSPDGDMIAMPEVVDGEPVVRVYSTDGGVLSEIDDAIWAAWGP